MDRPLNILLALGLALATSATAQDRSALEPGAEEMLPGAQTLRFHEIFDITGFLDGPLLPSLDDVPTDPREAAAFLEEVGERERQRVAAAELADNLADLLAAFLAPELAGSVTDISVKGTGGSLLLVVADERGHTWVADVLEQLRADPPSLVMIEALVVRGPAGAGVELKLEPTHTLLDEQAQIDLRQRFTALGLETISAPRLTTLPAQRGQVTILRELAYISDWQLRTVEPGGRRIADPTIEVLKDGLMLEVVALPMSDGHLGVSVRLTLSGVEEPIPTVPLRLADDLEPVEVGRPVVTTVGLETEVVLPSGGAVAFVTQDPERTQDVIVVLQVHRLAPQESARLMDR